MHISSVTSASGKRHPTVYCPTSSYCDYEYIQLRIVYGSRNESLRISASLQHPRAGCWRPSGFGCVGQSQKNPTTTITAKKKSRKNPVKKKKQDPGPDVRNSMELKWNGRWLGKNWWKLFRCGNAARVAPAEDDTKLTGSGAGRAVYRTPVAAVAPSIGSGGRLRWWRWRDEGGGPYHINEYNITGASPIDLPRYLFCFIGRC